MKVKCSTIYGDDTVGKMCRSTMLVLQDQLEAALGTLSFGGGIGRLMLVLVVVDSDRDRNLKFGRSHHGVFRDKDPKSGEVVKTLSLPLYTDPVVVASMDRVGLRSHICELLARRIGDPEMRLPKGFNISDLSNSLKEVLQLQ